MGDMPWGAHLCIFFETKADLLDTAATYFAAGLASNEFCVWVVSDPITEEDAKKLLRREIPNFDQHLAHGRIEILNKITGRWSEKLNGALARGYEGMRVSGNARLFGFHGSIHTPLDRCVRFARIVADTRATLAPGRPATALPGPDFHRLERASLPGAP